MVQDECVCVEVGDDGDQGDAPMVHAGASPFLEDRARWDRDFGGAWVVGIYFILLADGRAASCSKISGAEEQVANQCRDNVDIPGSCTYVVEQYVDGGCWGVCAVREDVAPVLLTADGIVLFNTPVCMLLWAASGLMQCNVCLSLSLSVW